MERVARRDAGEPQETRGPHDLPRGCRDTRHVTGCGDGEVVMPTGGDEDVERHCAVLHRGSDAGGGIAADGEERAHCRGADVQGVRDEGVDGLMHHHDMHVPDKITGARAVWEGMARPQVRPRGRVRRWRGRAMGSSA